MLEVVLLSSATVLPRAFSGDPDVRTVLVGALVVIALVQPMSGVVFVLDAGLTWLWMAYGVFILGRLVTLERRRRGTPWIVTGA